MGRDNSLVFLLAGQDGSHAELAGTTQSTDAHNHGTPVPVGATPLIPATRIPGQKRKLKGSVVPFKVNPAFEGISSLLLLLLSVKSLADGSAWFCYALQPPQLEVAAAHAPAEFKHREVSVKPGPEGSQAHGRETKTAGPLTQKQRNLPTSPKLAAAERTWTTTQAENVVEVNPAGEMASTAIVHTQSTMSSYGLVFTRAPTLHETCSRHCPCWVCVGRGIL